MTEKISAEQLDNIIALCQRTLEQNPRNATAHHDLAVALMEKRDFDAAISHFLSAVKLAPKHWLSHYLLGIAYAEKNMLDEAIAAWKKVLTIDKQNVNANYFLGKVYAVRGMTDAALHSLKKAYELQPENAMITNAMAEVHVVKGDLAAAYEEWKKSVESQPDNTKALLNICAVSLDRKQYEECLSYGERVLELGLEDANLRYNMGLAYLNLGETEAAVESLSRAKELAPDDLSTMLNLGEAYDRAGKADTAVEVWQEAARKQPENAHPLYNIGVSFYKRGITDEARSAWQKALKVNPLYLPAYVALANLLVAEEDYPGAESLWETLLRYEPGNDFGIVNLVHINLKQHKYADALKHTESAIARLLAVRTPAAVPGTIPIGDGKSLAKAAEADRQMALDYSVLWAVASHRTGRSGEALAAFADSLRQDAGVLNRNQATLGDLLKEDDIKALETLASSEHDNAVIANLKAILAGQAPLAIETASAEPESRESFWASLMRRLRQ